MKPRNHVAIALSKRKGGSGAHVKKWKARRMKLNNECRSYNIFKLPQNTELGTLQIDEVFLFCDIPRLFTCKSSNYMYLVLSIDDDMDSYQWLFLLINSQIYSKLINKNIDLRTAYTTGELLYLVSHNNNVSSVKLINANELSDDLLPNIGMYL